MNTPRFGWGVGLLALLLLVGCEAQLDAPSTLSLETRNALEVLPGEAMAIAHLDVRAMGANEFMSPFGQGRLSLESMNREAAARMLDFMSATGMNPQKDISDIYLAISGDANEPDGVSMVVYADFERERLESYIEERLAGDVAKSRYRGATIYTHQQRSDEGGFALVNDEMLLAASDADLLEAMIDGLQDGRSGAVADDPAMMDLIRKASVSETWFVARGLNLDASPGAGASQEMLSAARIARTVRNMVVTINVEPDRVRGEIILEPDEGVAPDDMAAVARGLVAAMKADANLTSKQLEALDGVEIRSRNGEVSFRMNMTNEMLLSLDRERLNR